MSGSEKVGFVVEASKPMAHSNGFRWSLLDIAATPKNQKKQMHFKVCNFGLAVSEGLGFRV